MISAKKKAEELLKEAGITINGDKPWDIQVHNENLYRRVISGGALAIGESYMDGWWDAECPDEFIGRLLSSRINRKVKGFPLFLLTLKARLFNRQSVKRASQVAEEHYDVGNDLYRAMLGESMVYTCAYWKDANTLQEAQEAKLDLVCKKIGLKKGDRVLDIGGGWGTFGKFAAEKYGAHVTAITLSKEQAELGKELTKGLSVEIRLQDYRDVKEQFDHVVSIGMFEHVGHKNFRLFMETVSRILKDDGLFLLHTIGSSRTLYNGDPWFDKYIFPNGMFPSISQIGKSIEEVFVMEDWHNFGFDYSKTLEEWFQNFDKAWPTLKDNYNDSFYRMWKYYLKATKGMFAARQAQLWQIVLSKKGVEGGYKTVR